MQNIAKCQYFNVKFYWIRVVGKGSWKKREVGKLKVEKSDVKMERMKLESSV